MTTACQRSCGVLFFALHKNEALQCRLAVYIMIKADLMEDTGRLFSLRTEIVQHGQ